RNNRERAAAVHASFEPLKALLFDEIETELAEAGTCSIVAEPGTEDQIHQAICVARPIAVAVLRAQVRHSQQHKAPQIHVEEVGGEGREFRKDLHRGSPIFIGHERQVEKRLNRSTAKLRPKPLVLCHDLLVRRAQWAGDAGLTQVLDADLYRTVGTSKGCVKSRS